MPTPILLLTSLAEEEERRWRDTLAKALPEERLVLARDDDAVAAEIAIVANPAPGSLREFTTLRWIHSLWAGVDRLLDDPSLPDIPVVRLVDPALARSMAEAVAAAALFIHRDLPAYAEQQRRQLWLPRPVRPTSACVVAVLGMGAMGSAAAKLLKGLDFQVRGWRRSQVTSDADPVRWSSLDRVVSGADIVVNLLPLTPATRGILDHRLFVRLKPGAAIINFGRGQHLVASDLLSALASGHIGHAVLDVFNNEPLPRKDPFWYHPQVTVLPHVAAPTTKQSAAEIVAENIRNYRRTGQLPAAVNRQQGY